MRNAFVTLWVLCSLLVRPLSGMAAPAAADSGTTTGTLRSPSAVVASAGEATAMLQAMRAAIGKASDVDDIRKRWEVLADSLRRLAYDSTVAALEQLSLKQLQDQRIVWMGNRRRVNAWRDSLQARTLFFESQSMAISEMESRWRETRVRAKKENFPPSLVERIDGVIALADTVGELLSAPRERILLLLENVSDGSIAIERHLSAIDQAVEQSFGKLLAQESPPLWETVGAGQGLDLGEGIQGVRGGFEATLQYLAARPGKLAAEIGLFLLLYLFLHVLRRWAGATFTKEDEEYGRGLQALFRRPVAGAALLTLLATRLVFPSAPSTVSGVVAIVMIIPILLLARELLAAEVRPALYALGGFFLLHRLHFLTPEHTLLYRFLSFLIALLGLAGLLIVRRRQSIWSNLAPGAWSNFARTAGLIAFVALVASMAANIFGYNALADFLLYGTLNTAYSVVAVLAASLVLEGIGLLLLRTPAATASRAIRLNGQVILRGWTRTIRVVATLVLIGIALTNFGLLERTLGFLGGLLGKEWAVGSLHLSIGGILAFVLAIWGSVLVSRFIALILDEDVFSRMELRRGVAAMLTTMVRYAIITFGFIFAAGVAGIQMSQIALLVGALGVGIGFGLQGLVSNIVAGLILIFERPINPGDTVEFGNRMGTVDQIGPRASLVKGFDGAEIIVPNSTLISSEVVNYTLTDRRRRLEIPVGVAYGSDPKAVAALLLESVRKVSGVTASPEPMVLFQGFGESALNFVVRFWVADFDSAIPVRSEVAMALYGVLRDGGIEIPFPQRDLHLKSIPTRKRNAKDEVNEGEKPAPPRSTTRRKEKGGRK